MLELLENYLADTLIAIPGGLETMRSFYDEQKWMSSDYKMAVPGRKSNQKELCITAEIEPFMLSKFPVTRGLYDYVVGDRADFSGGGLPVVDVSWYDVVLFCNSLSEAVGLNPCYLVVMEKVACDWGKSGLRLPSEAEWQYACHRSGSRIWDFGLRKRCSISSRNGCELERLFFRERLDFRVRNLDELFVFGQKIGLTPRPIGARMSLT